MNELPKVLRLRAERIAQVHFDNVFATDNPNIVQGLLPDGSYVVVDLLKRVVVKPPVGYHIELDKKEDAGIIADHSSHFTDTVTRESVEPTQPNKAVKKKAVKKITASKKSSKK